MNNYKFTKSIKIPNNVHVFLERGRLVFVGPLGINTFDFLSFFSDKNCSIQKSEKFPKGFQLGFRKNENHNEIIIENLENSKEIQTYGNTLASLLNKKMIGVMQGFFISLEIRGIGYRVSLKEIQNPLDLNGQAKQKLSFKLGYSHDIELVLPTNVRAFCPKPNLLCIYGVDYQFLSQICAKIRSFKKPEVYKGKGIRFKDEEIRLRVGKRK